MISIFINSLTSGGAEKVALTLHDRFRSTGNEMELFFIEKERFYDLPEGTPVNYLSNKETLEKSWWKIPYIFLGAIRLKRQVRKNKIPIVQSHLPRANFTNVLARILGSRHFAQIVIHSRMNFDHQPAWKRILSKWIFRQVFMRADSVISICDVMKNEMDTYLGLEKHPNHRRIYNPHQLEDIRQKAAEPIDGFNFSPDKKYIIWAGRFVARKRVGDLLEALKIARKSFPKVELLLLGLGEEKEAMERLTEKLELTQQVHFLGYQSNPFAFIAKSDLMVICSSMEGLPNIIIESLACGTPVVSADCISGPREILYPDSDLSQLLKDKIELGDFGILHPVGRADLLAKALLIILEDETLRDDYIRKGYERAADFEAEKIGEIYLNSFPNII
ncbi:MAG: glycosyltransferase involved in cell wall biosynthesis [Saprospiraceae bacterium]|jgi:glycosyltransferase involved in cell wall biosynthesis